MSETPTPSSEPATAPVATIPPAAPLEVRDERRHSRLTAVAAWVGIVAGVVFTVAVIFFSGFILGAHGGGHHGGGHKGDRGDHGFAVFRGGPPPGFPMPPDGQFERPGRPGFGSPPGPGGPGFEAPAQPGGPQSPGSPTTTPRP